MDMICNLINNAVSAGFGAFAGAWGAWLMSARAEKQRNREKYANLLIILHDDLETIYNRISKASSDCVKEVEGNKFVEFDMPFPEFSLSKEQIYQIAALAPDKDIPVTLLKMQKFLFSHNSRIAKDGKNMLSLQFLQAACEELAGELLSVEVQYKQETGEEFPTAAGFVKYKE